MKFIPTKKIYQNYVFQTVYLQMKTIQKQNEKEGKNKKTKVSRMKCREGLYKRGKIV